MAISEKSLSDKIEKTSIMEEIRKKRENDSAAFNTKYSHKEDLEKLLKLAEDLKDSSDKAKSGIKRQRGLTIIGAVMISLAVISYPSFTNDTSNSYLNIFAGFVGITFLIVIDHLYFVKNYKQRYLADKLALSEVLQLLRETSNIIAEQEDWSALSRAEFRIRLSRFNLE